MFAREVARSAERHRHAICLLVSELEMSGHTGIANIIGTPLRDVIVHLLRNDHLKSSPILSDQPISPVIIHEHDHAGIAQLLQLAT